MCVKKELTLIARNANPFFNRGDKVSADGAAASPGEGVSGNIVVAGNPIELKKKEGSVTEERGTGDVVKENMISDGLLGTL